MTPPQFENISVRAAKGADLDAIIEFNAALALETEGKLLDKGRLRSGVRSVLESSSQGAYVVVEVKKGAEERQVIGQLLITYEWSDWRNANFWWIQSVYVHSEWRKQGVFRILYEYVMDQAESRSDVCGVRLYVEQDNASALAVYHRMGLRPTPYRILEVDFVPPPIK